MPKLGSEDDPIRRGLFACEPLNDLVQRLKLNGSPGPFQTMADAAELANAGKKDEARSRLHIILEHPGIETRVQLLAWLALRELGERPDARAGGEVLGSVIEVPMHGAYDTLAAYQDGSARYLNFSGRAIFWDWPDPTIKSLCQKILASAASAGSQAEPRIDTRLPTAGTQVTLLTRAGMYVIRNSPHLDFRPAVTLMLELVKRAKEKNSQ